MFQNRESGLIVRDSVCESENFDLFCDFFMHERHVIFVNMMTFDKTNPSHRQAVESIFTNLFREGKKRGYSKYRSHVNTMGEFKSLQALSQLEQG